MNTPSGNDPENLAKQRLSQACRAMDKSDRLRWVLILGEVLLVLLLSLALLDYWMLLPLGLRAGAALCLGALMLFGLVRLVRFFLKPTRLKQGALAIESKRPDLGCEISTAAEYLA